MSGGLALADQAGQPAAHVLGDTAILLSPQIRPDTR